jgi:hypothetical protein
MGRASYRYQAELFPVLVLGGHVRSKIVKIVD